MSSEAPERTNRVGMRLDELLRERGMTLTELASRTGITMANLSILKTGKAKAVRFTTLTALCEALDVTPDALLVLRPSGADELPPS